MSSNVLKSPWVSLGTAGLAAVYLLSHVPCVRGVLSHLGIFSRGPVDALDVSMRKVASSLSLKSFICVDDLSSAQIRCIIELASFFKKQVSQKLPCKFLDGKVMTTLFYEASTRTRCSFETAMLRLGGTVVSVSGTTSSSVKGETLEDSVRVLSSYCDILVLRHPENNVMQRAKAHSLVPLVSAGDGSGEHPTQAILDLYTLCVYFPVFEKELTIGFVGDLKYARTIHSLVKLLSRFNVVMRYISPKSLQMPPEIQREVEQNFAKYNIPDLAYPRQTSFSELADGIENCDALYVTRVQKERMPKEEYELVKSSYLLDKSVLEKLPPHVKILHPLPRIDEVSPEIDSDERCVYFEQAQNGLYVRMALLYLLLNS